MYAGSAFVLFDLANNVVEPMNLPAWLPRVIIWTALLGFPIAVILSWIFDITPEGIDKTKSFEEVADSEEKQITSRRRLKVSDVIIVALIILVGILTYPRIFGTESLNAMTVPVTIVNEFGERETRRVFKEDYLTRLALLPFDNEVNDTSVNWLWVGIPEAVKEDMRQFPNILIAWDDATHLNKQIAFANEKKFPFFLTGSFRVDDNIFEITTRLHQASNGSVRHKHIYRGADFFGLMDSICIQVRRDLGVSEIIINSTPDVPISSLMTENLNAYKYYIQGRYFAEFETVPALPVWKAIHMDSTFARACYLYAYWCYNFQLSDVSAKRSIDQAIRHRKRLSEYNDIETRITNYLIMGDTAKVVDLLEDQYELRPWDLNLLNSLRNTYFRLNLYERAIDMAIRMNELIPNYPSYQLLLAHSYLFTGKPNKSLDVLNSILAEYPENVEALLKIGEAYLHIRDLDAAEKAFTRAITLTPEQENNWYKLLEHIDFVRKQEITVEFLRPYVNIQRDEKGGNTFETRIIENQLRFKYISQGGFFAYPVSDSVFVYAFKDGDTFSFIEYTWILSRGKPRMAKFEQRTGAFFYSTECWVEDSQILQAKNLLAVGRTSEALAAFLDAYNQNPEHYYLANYIQHLEFILNPDFDSLVAVLNSYVGKYGELSFHTKDDKFYYTDYEGLTYELLPLSEDTFMVPSRYELNVQIVQKNGQVGGLKYLYRDGREEFFQRTMKESISNS